LIQKPSASLGIAATKASVGIALVGGFAGSLQETQTLSSRAKKRIWRIEPARGYCINSLFLQHQRAYLTQTIFSKQGNI